MKRFSQLTKTFAEWTMVVALGITMSDAPRGASLVAQAGGRPARSGYERARASGRQAPGAPRRALRSARPVNHRAGEGVLGKRLSYDELIAPNGLDSGARLA